VTKLRDAVDFSALEEVPDRVLDRFRDETAADLAVVRVDLLGAVDLAEPFEAVPGKPLDDEHHAGIFTYLKRA